MRGQWNLAVSQKTIFVKHLLDVSPWFSGHFHQDRFWEGGKLLPFEMDDFWRISVMNASSKTELVNSLNSYGVMHIESKMRYMGAFSNIWNARTKANKLKF